MQLTTFYSPIIISRDYLTDCRSLESIFDISMWNTNKIFDIGYMFYNCIKLKKLPNSSKWSAAVINNMKYIFENCKSFPYSFSKYQPKKIIASIRELNYRNNIKNGNRINIKEKREIIINPSGIERKTKFIVN